VTFEEFAAARLPALLRYAIVLTGDRGLAEDLVQEVLIRIHLRWRKVASLDRPELYVKRALTNEFLSWRRRWKTRNPAVGLAGLVDMVGLAPDSALPDPAGLVAERADLWSRVAALPRQQRVVLALRYYEGLTDTEIAEVLDCAPGTVRGYASRAVAALRADLTDREHEELG
jgi:RNA polymerase sigma-70 factor (sigma-E family)